MPKKPVHEIIAAIRETTQRAGQWDGDRFVGDPVIYERTKLLALADAYEALEKQIHDMCHDLHVDGPVTVEEFCDGCEQFQQTHFGVSPITGFRVQVAYLTAEREQLLEGRDACAKTMAQMAQTRITIEMERDRLKAELTESAFDRGQAAARAEALLKERDRLILEYNAVVAAAIEDEAWMADLRAENIKLMEELEKMKGDCEAWQRLANDRTIQWNEIRDVTAERDRLKAEVELLTNSMAWSEAKRDRLKADYSKLLAALRELLSGHDNLYRAYWGPDSDPHNDLSAKAARDRLKAELKE